jgi:hypothetical protein
VTVARGAVVKAGAAAVPSACSLNGVSTWIAGLHTPLPPTASGSAVQEPTEVADTPPPAAANPDATDAFLDVHVSTSVLVPAPGSPGSQAHDGEWSVRVTGGSESEMAMSR